MLTNLFSNSTLPMLEHVVQFTQARHGVLAGNIANLDTPDYKTRDLSVDRFQTSLKKALDSSRQPQSQGETELLRERGLIASQTTTSYVTMPDHEAYADVRESMKSILFHDGSNVSMEKQITEISKNQSQHTLAIRLMSSQFNQLRAAISERVV